ncbi:cytochrome c [Paracoccus suum]|uniref:Cytochrome c n=2 Tax=Paracoccus suum TaxID=2259340 RepID=A0A344PPI9_9RHOB|nr:cytochrome c [Paracoccus suum]
MKTLGLALISACALAAPALAAPVTYDLPSENETATLRPGDGMDVAEANCGTCHSADYIEYQPPGKGAKFWDAEVHKMIATYGAQITEEDAAKISAYLAAQY